MGNAYILGGQVKDVKNELGAYIKEVRDDVKGLIRGQTELEMQEMAVLQKLVLNYGKKN